jgi:hypothetical protein
MYFYTKKTDNKNKNIIPLLPDKCLRLFGILLKKPTNKLCYLKVWLNPALI